MIKITSTLYNASVEVKKDNLLKYFPNSLFGLILEQDPIATEIPLNHPVVKPGILEIVEYLTSDDVTWCTYSCFIWQNVLMSKEIIEAGRYLLMPIFEIFVDPNLTPIPYRGYYIDYRDISDLRDVYLDGKLMYDLIRKLDISIFKYILNHLPHDHETDKIGYELFRSVTLSMPHSDARLFYIKILMKYGHEYHDRILTYGP